MSPEPKQPGTATQGGEHPALRLLLDLGPLILFFTVNAYYGIFVATAVFMVAILAALAASRILTGKFAKMPLITAVFVLVFGGLTIYLQDETFIKIKPTIIYFLFAGLLLGGLAVNRVFLKSVMGELFQLHDGGWRLLTYRWAGFFVALAILNEVVWRNFSTSTWVSFKVFGLLPLTLIFAALQAGLLQKHAKPRD
ncbi:putative intracellular septation protein A [bacterium BMS3Bbin10]|nr:putative intracellular septation protein A [bacterium BMS3Bbin10]HDL16431.1 septation protein A [Hyphomicrobiales bacterium]